jgi:molecular chaperone GrpE
MSEPTPAFVDADAAGQSEGPLTPAAIDAILADFRSWLERAAREGALPPLEPPVEPPVDLHTLLGQMTALKQEVHLQTRAVRTQQEQNAAGLEQLTAAVEKLRQAQAAIRPTEDRAVDDALRPVLLTLIELHDAGAIAARELERARKTASVPTNGATANGQTPKFESILQDLLGLARMPRGWFSLGSVNETALNDCAAALRREHQTQLDAFRQASESTEHRAVHSVQQVDRVLDSLATGFGMSLQRVERALQKHGLERIGAVGDTFDPEVMEVVEVVRDSDAPNGAVLEVVRPGYLRKGRVFRYAQVRVAKREIPVPTRESDGDS